MRIGPIVWELDGPGPILKNSSTAVMTGPLDFCTTARSCDTPDGWGDRSEASTLVGSTGFEQPVATAAALPKIAALANSRRLMKAVSFFGAAGAQDWHPV